MQKYPLSKEETEKIVSRHKTPFHIYFEKELRENARRFKKAFSILPGFKEFFAVKANPNPYLMKILREEGFGADCSSLPELMLAEKVGIVGEDIMFSSNDTPAEDFVKCKQLGGLINLDDISHIGYLEKVADGLPEVICFRFNPGPEREGSRFIGDPKEAKYGFTRKQLMEGYKICKEKGVKRFGLHTMVVSNELNENYFIETARMLFDLVVEIYEKTGIKMEFVNLGGGIGIAQEPGQKAVDYDEVAKGVKEYYDELIAENDLGEVKVFLECGRVITGPYGYLITSVRHMKHIYKDYVGTDACMANLMRPGMYGAYHHITVIGKEDKELDHTYDVTGSLCENNDKFAIDRRLPEIEVGDLLAIHDSGAHGHSMGFNYNGKLRSAELLYREDGSVVEIRRAEKVDDYFATLDFDGLEEFK